MTGTQKQLIAQVMSEEIKNQGFIRLNQLTRLLESRLKDYHITRAVYEGQGPKRWLSANFPEFRIDGDNGKEIILFVDQQVIGNGATMLETEVVTRDSLCFLADGRDPKAAYTIGVISYLNNNIAYINGGFPCEKNAENNSSVFFDPKFATFSPSDITFDTKRNIYLVAYAASNTTIDETKDTGIDYKVSIVVLRTILKQNCRFIEITNENITISCWASQENGSFEESLRSIKEHLIKEIEQTSYVHASSFPEIAKTYGLVNFRSFAESIEMFLKEYLADFELLTNYPLDGKVYPGLIVKKGCKPKESNVKNNISEVSTDLNTPVVAFEILDRLFDEEKYVEFLSSDSFKNTSPQNLPLEMLEKALTCAERLLHPDSTNSIALNTFQKEVYYNSTTTGFIKKWKKEGMFDNSIIKECAETAVASFVFPDDQYYVVKLLNAIGYEKTVNNNYVGIAARFAACENILTPHFYILRAFVLNTIPSIQRITTDCCRFVKGLKQSSSVSRLSIDMCLNELTNVLKVIQTNIVDVSLLSQGTQTNIISTYIEYESLDMVYEVISMWDKEYSTLNARLIKMYFDITTWNEAYVCQLFQEGVNLQLLQRCVAMIWRKYSEEQLLPKCFIELLALVAVYHDTTSIDEIIRYHCSKNLSRIQKQQMLLCSFAKICEYSWDNYYIYVLASYVALTVFPNINQGSMEGNTREELENWTKYSDEFFQKAVGNIGEINHQNEHRYLDLFRVFQLDVPHYLLLQTTYAAWALKVDNIQKEETNICVNLDDLYNKRAYAAYIDLFLKERHTLFGDETEKYELQYISSLLALHKYVEAVSAVSISQNITYVNKKNMLVKALGENFRENGIAEEAFMCLGETLSCNEAIELLLPELSPNQFAIINILIALYIRKKEYMKAAFLFVVFCSKADKGYVRLYRQFRSALGKYIDFNKYKNYTYVIELAFHVLNAADLVEFLSWTNKIKLPDIHGQKDLHIFHYYFDEMTADAFNKEKWISFLNHLLKKGIDKNAWYICVCETVLRRVMHYTGTSVTRNALDLILKNNDITSIAPGFLICAFNYIEDHQSIEVARMLVEALADKGLYRCAITDNRWYETYADDIEAFKKFCLNAYDSTGNEVYHEVLNALEVNLEISELRSVAQSTVSKETLFSKICSNFLNGYEFSETQDMLFSDQWNGLSDIELELLNILRMIYDDDDQLLESIDLFENEISVYRFKRDCVEILSTYPEKTGLFAFHNSCVNETYKMLVYSYVFNVFYDQDLYGSFDKPYSEFLNNKSLKAYLRMMKTSYKIQSIRNTSYPVFYKKWRYIKLYLVHVLMHEDLNDDSSIVRLMRQNGHYEEFYSDSYFPFVKRVKEFLAFTDISQEDKEHFLFAIMVGNAINTDEFLSSCANNLCCLNDQQKIICKQLLETLDYRYFAASLYKHFWNDIQSGEVETALNVASVISDYAYDAIVAYSNLKDFAIKNAFKEIAFAERPSKALNSFIAKTLQTIEKYGTVLVPVLCSRQFVFHINDRYRSLVIQKQDNIVCEQYKYISDYLVSKGKKSALSIYNYLSALVHCLNKDRESVLNLITTSGTLTDVPFQWQTEAQRMIDFANGSLTEFKADRTVVDGSQEDKKRTIIPQFAEKILERKFHESPPCLDVEGAKKLYELYSNTEDENEKAYLGIQLLAGISKYKLQKRVKSIPLNRLGLDVGTLILQPKLNYSVEDQFLVAAKLFENRDVYSKDKLSAQFESIKNRFLALINSNVNLSLWVKHAAIIETCLIESQMLLDFRKLHDEILKPCRRLQSPEISYDEKDEQYKILLESFTGLTSVYSKNVMTAISNERSLLGDGIKISIIVEDSTISDGHIYFQLYNKGGRTVSFKGDALSVVLLQANQPEKDVFITNICDLQSGAVTGATVPVVISEGVEKISAKICVFRKNAIGTKDLVCFVEKVFSIIEPTNMIIPVGTEYDVKTAITDDDMLFGRDQEKEWLRRLVPTGVTLIYGPSRIGKTSLMNWIRNTLAYEKGNVATLLFGGENGKGKDGDYTRNFLDNSKPVPYDNDDEMSSYLLVDTLIYGFTQKSRFDAPTSSDFPRELSESILSVLFDTSTTIESKYYEINDRLTEKDVELWLLLDEFQQVVERWTPQKWSEFISICSWLSSKEKNKPNNIKLIVCGSDDLLEHMILRHDSVWKNAFSSTVPVGALNEKSFSKMIKYDRVITQTTNLLFSDEALHALYTYTGGVALYGKEICNTMLEDIERNPLKCVNRNKVYTFDIAEATQKLLDQQAYELSTKAQEGISKIYAAVIKNLRYETDIQLLCFMAKWLYENKKQEGFPKNVFTAASLTSAFREGLDDSLRIAKARGIIRSTTQHGAKIPVYTFTSLFYLYAFYGNAKDKLREDLIFEENDAEGEVKKSGVSRVVEDYQSLSVKERNDALGQMWRGEGDDVRESFRKDFFPPQTIIKTDGGDVVTGGKIQVYTQSISTTLTGIFAASAEDVSQVISGLKDLPRLATYFDGDQKPLLAPMLKNLNSEDPELIVEAETQLEEKTTQMVSDYLAALVSHESTPEKFCVWDQFGIGKSAYDKLSEKIGPSFMAELILAAKLDYIFGLANRDSTGESPISDYSPVSIMYCKVLEKMLKFYHTDIYCDRCPEVSTEVKRNGVKIKFSDLFNMSNADKLSIQNKILLGAFLYPIDPDHEHNWLRIANNQADLVDCWKNHGVSLAKIRSIRNDSAHGAEGVMITKERLNELKELMFKQGGLSNIITLRQ